MKTDAQKTQNQKVPQGGADTTKKMEAPPSFEQVHDWSKADLRAAIAFLSMLQSNPQIFEALTQMIYAHALEVNKKPKDPTDA